METSDNGLQKVHKSQRTYGCDLTEHTAYGMELLPYNAKYSFKPFTLA